MSGRKVPTRREKEVDRNLKFKKFEDALLKIAQMGSTIPPGVRDYSNIGKNAVRLAQDTLAGNCNECGRQLEFK
jgi:hypothetical protein